MSLISAARSALSAWDSCGLGSRRTGSLAAPGVRRNARPGAGEQRVAVRKLREAKREDLLLSTLRESSEPRSGCTHSAHALSVGTGSVCPSHKLECSNKESLCKTRLGELSRGRLRCLAPLQEYVFPAAQLELFFVIKKTVISLKSSALKEPFGNAVKTALALRQVTGGCRFS